MNSTRLFIAIFVALIPGAIRADFISGVVSDPQGDLHTSSLSYAGGGQGPTGTTAYVFLEPIRDGSVDVTFTVEAPTPRTTIAYTIQGFYENETGGSWSDYQMQFVTQTGEAGDGFTGANVGFDELTDISVSPSLVTFGGGPSVPSDDYFSGNLTLDLTGSGSFTIVETPSGAFSAVPEPGSWFLLGSAVVAIVAASLRTNRRRTKLAIR